MNDEDVRHRHKVGDRNEIGQAVVRDARVRSRIDCHRGDGRDAERVAVRRGLGNFIGTNRATATTAIFNDDRLAQFLA